MATAGIATPSMLARYGAANITNRDEERGASSNGFATLQSGPGQASLPDWLSTDPNALIGELMQTYQGVGGMFNPSGIRNAYNKSIDTTMGMGGQIADNAMREGISRAGMEGGGVNSAMLKAQAMLPVYEATGKMRSDRELAVADMRTREAGMRASLSQAIGQMRTSYLSMLANTYLSSRGQNMSYVAGQESRDLERERFDLQKQLATQGTGGGSGSAPIAPFQGQITRAPNGAGGGRGVEYTPEYLDYLQATGNYDAMRAGPRDYPSGGGIAFGDQLDEYEAWQRQMLNTADPRTPAYNYGMAPDIYGMTGGYAGDPNYDPMTGLYNGKRVVRSA